MSLPDRATFKVRFETGVNTSRTMRVGNPPTPVPKPVTRQSPRRVPRVAKLMALALRFDWLVRSGQVKDFAEIARLGHVTRGRLSQIMDLVNLAPDIQEQLLFLAPPESGKDRITEKQLRPVTRQPDWATQRRLWRALNRTDDMVSGPAPDGVVAMRAKAAQVE